MNRVTTQNNILFKDSSCRGDLQDKIPHSRYYPASDQPYTPLPDNVYSKNHVYKHSENRKTVNVSARIDLGTDEYIEHRLRSGKRLNKDLTRSRVVAEMLAERSRDETFERSQTILVPIIQDTMRAEFHTFENRFLGIIARLSYYSGWILSLTRQFVSIALAGNPTLFHRIDEQSETAARVSVSERTVHIDEVKHRLQEELGK